MKKILFVLVSLVMSVSCFSQSFEQAKYTQDSLKNVRDSLIKIIDDSIGYYKNKNVEVPKYNFTHFLLAYNELDVDICGGCTPKFKIYNMTKKTIKYIHLQIRFYNRVNDPVNDKIHGSYVEKYNIVGPIDYLKSIDVHSWDSKFYNTTADHFVITSMTIQYMDKSSITFNKAQIKKREIDYSYFDDITYGKYDKKIVELENKKQQITKYYNNLLNTILSANNQFEHNSCASSAEFPGGYVALMKYISTHIIYPIAASNYNIQGKVIAQFVIEKDGKVGDVKIIRSVSPEIDAEAIRVLKTLPNFIPAKNENGKLIRSQYVIPITFKI